MTLTEEEAKKKICPQPDMMHCLASKCMAWRWVGNVERFDGGSRKPPVTGFCGLAGTP